jgi:predicted nucleic acid-binding protein
VRESWVVDASPLIALGTIGRLDLLASLAEEVVVPDVVGREVLQIPDEAARALANSSFRSETVDTDDVVRGWGLGQGETAVLSFAKRNSGYVAILGRPGGGKGLKK